MDGQNKSYVIAITLVATLGGLLFGYDTAVISGAEKSVQAYLIDSQGLSSIIHGITTSSALIGCIIGGLISGLLATRFGRKKSLQFAAILFFISALGSGYPEFLFFKVGEPTIGLLLMFNFYRVIGGIGVGLASALSPMYIGEVAPANIRGRLVSLNQFAIIFGMLVVYFVNWGIAHGQPLEWINEIGWRRMFVSETVPAGLFGLLLFLVPETPRYLALKSQEEKAFQILTKINGRDRAQAVLQDIKESLRHHTSGKLFSFGKTVIIIGILLSVFQQFVGINVALYYAPRIFESMGAAKDASMLQTVIMGLVNVIFTVVAIFTVDNWGRKPLLIVGSAGMALGMFAIAGLAFFDIIGISTLVFMIIYTASFMMSWGPITWVLISEIFPNKIRGKAVAIAVAAQWTANYLVSSTYPAMMEFSGAMTYSIYGIMSVLSLLFVWKFVPETKGRTLEDMEALWEKKK
jgi:SP family xylose:H+ symportor-like MFS transporter